MDNDDGTVTDTRTGLIGLKNANCLGAKTWEEAMSETENLADGSCGLTDGSSAGEWRLPTKEELQILIEWRKSGVFSGVQSVNYWSGSDLPNNSGLAWHVHLHHGYINGSSKTGHLYVWPVRSGQ